jgi:hypothetical protein
MFADVAGTLTVTDRRTVKEEEVEVEEVGTCATGGVRVRW